jgi:hypothetical protein
MQEEMIGDMMKRFYIIIACVSVMMFLSSCCTPPPADTTDDYEEGNQEVGNQGVCGDKACTGNEADPQNKGYCKQDCYPN